MAITESGIYRIYHQSGTKRPALYGGRAELAVSQLGSTELSSEEVERRFSGIQLPFAACDQTRIDGTNSQVIMIGAGAYSVATRHLVENGPDSPTSKRTIIAVSKPMVGQAINDYEHRVNGPEKYLPGFVHPYSTMVAQGFDGRPAIYKVSQEVPGATIHDLGPLYLLANPFFLKQYVEFASGVMKMFFESPEHFVVDVVGRQNRHLPSRMWEHLFQFNSENLMIDFKDGGLRLIDSGLVNQTDSFTQARLIKKLRLLYLLSGLVFTQAVAQAALLAHRLLKYVVDRTERVQESEDKTVLFEHGFKKVIEQLEKQKIDYRVLGSFAIAGHVRHFGGDFKLTPTTKGERRDVDIVVLTDDRQRIDSLIDSLTVVSTKNSGCPIISLFLPKFERNIEILDGKTKVAKIGGLSSISFTSGENPVHRYKDLTINHGGEDFDPVEVTYAGTTFKTVRPDSIAGLALVRMGAYKFKDLDKMRLFFETTGASVPTKYIDFSNKIRQMHAEDYTRAVIREYYYFFPTMFRLFLKHNSILSPVVKHLLRIG